MSANIQETKANKENQENINKLIALYPGLAPLYSKEPLNTKKFNPFGTKQNISPEEATAFSIALNQNCTVKNLTLYSIREIGNRIILKALKDNKSIEKLVLDHFMLDLEEMKLLAEILTYHPHIKSLNLWDSSIDDNTVETFALGLQKSVSLIALDFWGVNVNDKHVNLLVESLLQLKQFDSLTLCDTSITEASCTALSKLIQYHDLHTLSLHDIALGINGITQLANAFKQTPSLRNLSLRNTQLDSECCKMLMQSLSQHHLSRLDLGSNKIDDEATEIISGWLKKQTKLERLILRRNSIGDKGAIALAKALETNQSLIQLCLGENSIGLNGINVIIESLKDQCSLELFKIDDNFENISNEQWFIIIAKMMKFELYNISNIVVPTSFTETDALKVIEATQDNPYVNNLLIEKISLGSEGIQAIAKAITTNDALRSVAFTPKTVAERSQFTSIEEAIALSTTVTDIEMVNFFNGLPAHAWDAKVVEEFNKVVAPYLARNLKFKEEHDKIQTLIEDFKPYFTTKKSSSNKYSHQGGIDAYYKNLAARCDTLEKQGYSKFYLAQLRASLEIAYCQHMSAKPTIQERIDTLMNILKQSSNRRLKRKVFSLLAFFQWTVAQQAMVKKDAHESIIQNGLISAFVCARLGQPDEVTKQTEEAALAFWIAHEDIHDISIENMLLNLQKDYPNRYTLLQTACYSACERLGASTKSFTDLFVHCAIQSLPSGTVEIEENNEVVPLDDTPATSAEENAPVIFSITSSAKSNHGTEKSTDPSSKQEGKRTP